MKHHYKLICLGLLAALASGHTSPAWDIFGLKKGAKIVQKAWTGNKTQCTLQSGKIILGGTGILFANLMLNDTTRPYVIDFFKAPKETISKIAKLALENKVLLCSLGAIMGLGYLSNMFYQDGIEQLTNLASG